MNHISCILLVALATFVFQCHGLFNCRYSCSRGSCNTYGRPADEIQLKCSMWRSCSANNGPCVDHLLWSCWPPTTPYTGKIVECNKPGCIPPFGCTLTSFETSTGKCQVSDDFCDSPNKVCCVNDIDCDKNMHPCTPPTALIFNTTTTHAPPTTTPTSIQESLNIPLIVVGSVCGLLFILFIVGYIIYRVRRSREMRDPNNFLYD